MTLQAATPLGDAITLLVVAARPASAFPETGWLCDVGRVPGLSRPWSPPWLSHSLCHGCSGAMTSRLPEPPFSPPVKWCLLQCVPHVGAARRPCDRIFSCRVHKDGQNSPLLRTFLGHRSVQAFTLFLSEQTRYFRCVCVAFLSKLVLKLNCFFF